MTYELVDAEKANYPTTTLCRILGISTSSFYEWRPRRADPSARARGHAALTERIRKIHAQSRGTYGAPRIQAELRLGGDIFGWRRPSSSGFLPVGDSEGGSLPRHGELHLTFPPRRSTTCWDVRGHLVSNLCLGPMLPHVNMSANG